MRSRINRSVIGAMAKVVLSIIGTCVTGSLVIYYLFRSWEVVELGVVVSLYWLPSIILFFFTINQFKWPIKYYGFTVEFCIAFLYALSAFLSYRLAPTQEGEDITVVLSMQLFCYGGFALLISHVLGRIPRTNVRTD